MEYFIMNSLKQACHLDLLQLLVYYVGSKKQVIWPAFTCQRTYTYLSTVPLFPETFQQTRPGKGQYF